MDQNKIAVDCHFQSTKIAIMSLEVLDLDKQIHYRSGAITSEQ